jgi:hypothetical protein
MERRAARRLYETKSHGASRKNSFADGQGPSSTALHGGRESVAKWRTQSGFVYKIAPRSTIARETAIGAVYTCIFNQ